MVSRPTIVPNRRQDTVISRALLLQSQSYSWQLYLQGGNLIAPNCFTSHLNASTKQIGSNASCLLSRSVPLIRYSTQQRSNQLRPRFACTLQAMHAYLRDRKGRLSTHFMAAARPCWHEISTTLDYSSLDSLHERLRPVFLEVAHRM
jgi:hypothetical protein